MSPARRDLSVGQTPGRGVAASDYEQLIGAMDRMHCDVCGGAEPGPYSFINNRWYHPECYLRMPEERVWHGTRNRVTLFDVGFWLAITAICLLLLVAIGYTAAVFGRLVGWW